MRRSGSTDLGATPDRIGRYEVRSLLGIGGFAAVYEAYDAALDAIVAVKLLEPGPDIPAVARERFITEAQLLRRVDNPHVVKVFDIGEIDDGRPFFVMEFASDGVLAHRIPAQPGQADAASLRAIVRGLGAGLTALHEAGVVHRDVKPANVLITGGIDTGDETVIGTGILRSTERVMIGDLGIAKDNERESLDPTILGGTPNFRAPEQMIRGSAITPAADVFGASGVLWNLLTGERPPDENSLDMQLASAPSEWRAVLRRGLHPDPAQRHATAAEWQHACLEVLGDTEDGASIGFRSVVASDTCPYKGLAAFQPDDAGLFFGRERLVDELVQRLQDSAALIVGGPSGSGKSSLVRAGLLPALERGVVPGSQNWRIVLCSPGTDAIGELAFHLRRITGDDTINAALLATDPDSVRRSLAVDSPVLLAIDQFEELFTLNSAEVQQQFVQALAALAAGSHSTVRVVLAVRADFYDSCAHHPWLAERINENQVLVGPMGSAELRRAIEGPAQRTGLHVEDGLVDEIIDDAGASAGSLPLVAHALMETWLRRRGHQLTVSGYREAGGVAGAIAQRAEDTYAALASNDQVRARDLVLQMTTPGENGPDTRRLLGWEEVPEPQVTQPVIDTFVDARLVTTSDEHIELAHETLLRSWPRATAWIDEARDDLRTRQRVADSAGQWESNDRDPDLLLRGTPLESLLDWADTQRTPLPAASQEFLLAGRSARDDQLRSEQAELSKRRRNRRLAFGALAVLLVAAIFQSINARRNEQVANQATEDAQRQVTLGLAATADAQAQTDPLFAMALATESASRGDSPVPEALGALATARTALADQQGAAIPLSDAIAVGNVLHLDLTGDGTLLVLGSRSGEVSFMDVATRTIVQRDRTHTKGVESVHISNGLDLLVTGGADGQILLWDLTEQPYVPEVLDTIDGLAVWSAQVSPDGTLLGAVTSDAGVTFYDMATRAPLGRRFDSAIERDALRSVFTQDSSELLVGNSKGELIRVDVEQSRSVEVLAPHGSNIWDIDLAADGRYIYSASNDGTVRRVELATMTVDPDFSLGMGDQIVEMRGVEALADGRHIITGAADGHIQRWDAVNGALLSSSAASHEDRVIDGAASADGSLYASLGDDQKVRLWDLGTRSRPTGEIILEAESQVRGVALGPDGIRAVGTDAGTVVLENERGESLVLEVGEGEVFGLSFTLAGDLVLADGRGALSLWNPRTGAKLGVSEQVHTNRVLDVVVDPESGLVISAGSDGRIVSWDPKTLQAEKIIAELPTEINGLAFAPGSELLSVDLSGRIEFWNLDGGRSREAISAGEDVLFSVAVDAANGRFGVGGGEESIAIFDLASGEKLSRLTPLAGGAVDLAFTDSGAVVGLSRRGSIAVWNPTSTDQLGPIAWVHRGLTASRLVLDEFGAAWSTGSSAESGTGRLHRLDLLDQRIACELADGVIDEQRRAKFLGDEPLLACA